MIAKLIVSGEDRAEAIARMKSAIDEFKIGPIKTTLPLHRRLMDAREFVETDFDIHYVERWLEQEEAKV